MLIIFDLDDTLIDTSGGITPFKLGTVLQVLQKEGLNLPDFASAYQELLSLNERSLKSKDALKQFLIEKKGESLFDRASFLMTTPLPSDFVVPTTPNAKEILEHFRKSCHLALVTGGVPSFQIEKLEKAGIDKSIFSKIAIPEDSIKKPFYKALLEEFSVDPKNAWVCGDRITMDLAPAFELGLQTVHMRHGRGKISETDSWVHHKIHDLSELKRIIRT